jgi:hypothetical protein
MVSICHIKMGALVFNYRNWHHFVVLCEQIEDASLSVGRCINFQYRLCENRRYLLDTPVGS